MSDKAMEILAALAGAPSAPAAGDNVAARQLLRAAPAPFGVESATQEALVSQWLSWCSGVAVAGAAPLLNAALETTPYLTGYALSGADLFVFMHLVSAPEFGAGAVDVAALPCLARWLDATQHALRSTLPEAAAALLPPALPAYGGSGLGAVSVVGMLAALPRGTAAPAAPAAAAAAPADDGGKKGKKNKKGAEDKATPSGGAQESKAGGEAGGKKAKKEKKSKKDKKDKKEKKRKKEKA
uniref:Nuclear-export cofactor Arc1-like N-terminal domain-containing protein n=1 Tax=Phaeomonas parva TaxID=124430 RepID=A0A7S1XQL5_9STRA|mmetsp:Transcript_28223/g.90303  ORF Transcript_28223/g.90303 Transcript_28223/m.90303 type:complete len:240 (+) Transcript_28223:26-745(+)